MRERKKRSVEVRVSSRFFWFIGKKHDPLISCNFNSFVERGKGGIKVHPEWTTENSMHLKRNRLIRKKMVRKNEPRMRKIENTERFIHSGPSVTFSFLIKTSPTRATRKKTATLKIAQINYMNAFVARMIKQNSFMNSNWTIYFATYICPYSVHSPRYFSCCFIACSLSLLAWRRFRQRIFSAECVTMIEWLVILFHSTG